MGVGNRRVQLPPTNIDEQATVNKSSSCAEGAAGSSVVSELLLTGIAWLNKKEAERQNVPWSGNPHQVDRIPCSRPCSVAQTDAGASPGSSIPVFASSDERRGPAPARPAIHGGVQRSWRRPPPAVPRPPPSVPPEGSNAPCECESAPSVSTGRGWLLIGEATDLRSVPVVVLVQSVAVLVVVFKLVIVPVPAMPALQAFPDLRVDTPLARRTPRTLR